MSIETGKITEANSDASMSDKIIQILQERNNLLISPEVKALGVQASFGIVRNIDNHLHNLEFIKYKNQVLERMSEKFTIENFKEDSILQGFRDLHTKVGRSDRDHIASPEVLRSLFFKKSRFPEINPLVNIYNLISLETGLALGAHDLDKIVGAIELKMTTGSEYFIPLGKQVEESVFPNEYAYIDTGNNQIICRMEVVQADITKITADTKNILLIVQGNSNTTLEYVNSALERTIELIRKYCS